MQVVEGDALESASLRALVAWYEARCMTGGWPTVAAFRAETLPPRALPHIGRVEVSTAPFRVYYRAVGSAISDSFGVEMSGRYLDELGIAQADDIAEWYRLALGAPGPVLIRGEQAMEGQSFVYEGCLLPLGAPADEPRQYVIGIDFQNTDALQSVLRRRRYSRQT